ncbi:MAG: DMT family transporter [Pseudomonadota bacterium]
MTDSRETTLMPSIVIALSAAVWGLYWIPLRYTEGLGVPPVWTVALFNVPLVLVGALMFVAQYKANRPLMARIVIAGTLAGAGLAFYGAGLMLTTVVRATLLFYLTPIWGTLIGLAILGERPGWARWTALTVALVGLALTLGLSPDDLSPNLGIGEVLGLIAGMVWAGAAAVIRSSGGLPTTGLAFVQFVAAFLITAGFALWLGEGMLTVEWAVQAANWWMLIGAAIMLATMFSIFMMLGRISPGRSGLLMMSEVIVAVFSAAILLPEEALGAWEWVGASLIIGAGFIEVLGSDQS